MCDMSEVLVGVLELEGLPELPGAMGKPGRICVVTREARYSEKI